MSKICPECGGPKNRQTNVCRSCYLVKHSRPENYIAKICPVCGQSFKVHKSQIERGQGKYCSRPCARSGSPTRKKAMPIVTCHVCGKQFEKYRSEIKKNVGDLHFCSSECWYAHNQLENHAEWNGGQNERINHDSRAWRKAVLDRDHGVCRRCHDTGNLEVHHIKRFGSNPESRWDVSNGITLCHNCHVLFRNREEEYEEILNLIASVSVVVINV